MANDEKLYTPYLALFKVYYIVRGVADTAVLAEQIGGGAKTVKRGQRSIDHITL